MYRTKDRVVPGAATLFALLVTLGASSTISAQAMPDEPTIQVEISRQEAAIAEDAKLVAESKAPVAVAALEAAYKSKLDAQKDDHATRFYYANFLGLLGRGEDANEHLQKVIQKVPTYAPAYHRTAVYFRDKKQIDRAKQELNRALELDGGYIPANLMLADLYIAESDDARAEPLLRRVLKERADSRSSNYRLGKLLYDRAREFAKNLKPAEATRAYREAIDCFKLVILVSQDAIDMTAGLTYFWLGHAYFHTEMKAEAYDAFRLAVRILPPSKEKERAFKNIAVIAEELGRDPLWDGLRLEIQRGLDNADTEARYRAARTLCDYFRKSTNAEAQAMMIDVLKRPHPDLQVRVLVARSLGVSGRDAATQKQICGHLVAVLSGKAGATAAASSEDDLVRASAAYGLAELGWREAIPALVTALNTNNQYLFGEVLIALETLAGTHSPSISVVADEARDVEFAERQKMQSTWQQWWENGGSK